MSVTIWAEIGVGATPVGKPSWGRKPTVIVGQGEGRGQGARAQGGEGGGGGEEEGGVLSFFLVSIAGGCVSCCLCSVGGVGDCACERFAR